MGYIRKADYIAKFGEGAWEKVLEKQRVKDHKRYDSDPEKARKKRREYYKNNTEKTLETNKVYANSKVGRATKLRLNYMRNDKENSRPGFNLPREWIIDHIFTSSCIYCGDSDWKHLGCDRIDNSLPHTTDNCVCACGICNVERHIQNMTVEEFVEYRNNNPREIDIKKVS